MIRGAVNEVWRGDASLVLQDDGAWAIMLMTEDAGARGTVTLRRETGGLPDRMERVPIARRSKTTCGAERKDDDRRSITIVVTGPAVSWTAHAHEGTVHLRRLTPHRVAGAFQLSACALAPIANALPRALRAAGRFDALDVKGFMEMQSRRR